MDIPTWFLNQLPQPLKENPFHLVWISGVVFAFLGIIEKLSLGIPPFSFDFPKTPDNLKKIFSNFGIALIIIGILLVNTNQFSPVFKWTNNFLSHILPDSSDSNKNTLVLNEAVIIIENYLNDKKEIFAPPYDIEKLQLYTTDEFYKAVIGCEQIECKGSIKWLKKNNAFLIFPYQELVFDNNTFMRSESTSEYMLTASISGSFHFYRNNKFIKEESLINYCNRAIYKFKLVDKKSWKISKVEITQRCK